MLIIFRYNGQYYQPKIRSSGAAILPTYSRKNEKTNYYGLIIESRSNLLPQKSFKIYLAEGAKNEKALPIFEKRVLTVPRGYVDVQDQDELPDFVWSALKEFHKEVGWDIEPELAQTLSDRLIYPMNRSMATNSSGGGVYDYLESLK